MMKVITRRGIIGIAGLAALTASQLATYSADAVTLDGTASTTIQAPVSGLVTSSSGLRLVHGLGDRGGDGASNRRPTEPGEIQHHDLEHDRDQREHQARVRGHRHIGVHDHHHDRRLHQRLRHPD